MASKVIGQTLGKVAKELSKNIKDYPLLNGARLTMQKTFTQEEVTNFASIVQDFNPIHINHDFVKQNTKYPTTIVQGCLTEGLCTSFASTDLPSGVVLMHKDAVYKQPLFVGEKAECDIKLDKRVGRRCYFVSDVVSLDVPDKVICTVTSSIVLNKNVVLNE